MQGPFAKNASWQLAACLCTLRLPCHGPSWLLFALPCSFKSEENARTIRQKVLRPPAGTLRGPTCSFYRVLPYKIALGLKNPGFFMLFWRGPGGSQEAPKRPTKGLLAAKPPRGPQEAPKRPQQGPKDTHIHTSSNMFTHIHICSSMFTHVHICSHLFTHRGCLLGLQKLLFCRGETRIFAKR